MAWQIDPHCLLRVWFVVFTELDEWISSCTILGMVVWRCGRIPTLEKGFLRRASWLPPNLCLSDNRQHPRRQPALNELPFRTAWISPAARGIFPPFACLAVELAREKKSPDGMQSLQVDSLVPFRSKHTFKITRRLQSLGTGKDGRHVELSISQSCTESLHCFREGFFRLCASKCSQETFPTLPSHPEQAESIHFEVSHCSEF